MFAFHSSLVQKEGTSPRLNQAEHRAAQRPLIDYGAIYSGEGKDRTDSHLYFKWYCCLRAEESFLIYILAKCQRTHYSFSPGTGEGNGRWIIQTALKTPAGLPNYLCSVRPRNSGNNLRICDVLVTDELF